jgi:hypothetical protein
MDNGHPATLASPGDTIPSARLWRCGPRTPSPVSAVDDLGCRTVVRLETAGSASIGRADWSCHRDRSGSRPILQDCLR